MSKHTAGPWTLSPTGRYVRHEGTHGFNICDLEVFGGPPEEGKANALLIKAAPLLLKACKTAAGAAGQDWLEMQLMLCEVIAAATPQPEKEKPDAS